MKERTEMKERAEMKGRAEMKRDERKRREKSHWYRTEEGDMTSRCSDN